METLAVRFEQRRGHFMIVEREPSLTREDLNETQLQMMKRCEIPCLLPLDIEEVDGRVSLRYALSGTRMLSEATRTADWSMSEMMGALCRLGEALEECRLYLLDADRIRLQDEFIFVGEGWNDLKFTYLPVDMPTLRRADDLERLIIRWMMKVKEPEGLTMQAVLRLVASPGFIPISLSRYARQYLSGTSSGREAVSSNDSELSKVPLSASLQDIRRIPETDAESQEIRKNRPWNLFHPDSGDLRPVSEMWGEAPDYSWRGVEDQLSAATVDEELNKPLDISRWRIVIVCISVFASAVSWRFLYLERPGGLLLMLCLCLTLGIGATVAWLWNGVPSRHSGRPEAKLTNMRDDPSWNEGPLPVQGPRFPSIPRMEAVQPPLFQQAEEAAKGALPGETTWVSGSSHETALLNRDRESRADVQYVLMNKMHPNSRIPLSGQSLVIGRSADVAQHVDESTGISRAHVELIRVSDQWKVKDLGSRNGSRLNDKPMAPYELYALQTGDCLTLAVSEYRFQRSDG
ncbi:FHA domain-containing protein [Cohnella endophytica]|uniref:FHA domain-containing protein n=1 Tax=Cohnella endophytica TaxID=2419778 RepID=A0A494XXS2_9BACL|nr:DUF6382 domain-containing protein [Cohnella endophytica]RKP53819.1 FHA domain-containing protein [Cohnella endophytica]